MLKQFLFSYKLHMKIMNYKIFYSFLVLSLFWSLNGSTQSLITLNSNDTLFLAGSSCSVLHDKNNQLTIQDVIKSTDFQQNANDHIMLGEHDEIYHWVKFKIANNNTHETYLDLLIPSVDSIVLYAIEDKKTVQTQQSGAFVAQKQNALTANNIIFSLKKSDKTIEYYLKIKMRWLDDLKPRIGTYRYLFEAYHRHDLIFGSIIGLVLVFIIYNLFVFFQLKEKVYLYYSLYLSSVSAFMFQYHNIVTEFIITNTPSFFDYIMVSIGLSGIFGALFAINFFETKKNVPELHRFYIGFLIVNIAYTLFTLTGNTKWAIILAYPLTPTETVLIIITSIVLWRKGNPTAKFYLFGWLAFTIGMMVFILQKLGQLPYNNFTAYALPIGVALEAIILSLAIVHRFKIMKQNADEVTKKSLLVLKENEELVKEKNRLLEQTVEEQNSMIQSALQRFYDSEEKLKEYALRLEKSNKELTDFAHIASHDLKAPIRGIMSFSQLFERRNATKFDDIDREYFNFIKANAKQSARLIDDVLSYSKIDKNLGEPENVDLNTCLYTIELNLKTLMQDKKAELIFEYLPTIKGHSSLINQLFRNLIANGIKYNTSEVPTIHISCKSNTKGHLVYAIKDNGIGIAPENHELVFSMFRRLHTQAEYEGSGIGLAFCARIVDTYGGQIWVESEEGKGTTIFFTLPTATIVKVPAPQESFVG
jgi:signal transduction histidine kinase